MNIKIGGLLAILSLTSCNVQVSTSDNYALYEVVFMHDGEVYHQTYGVQDEEPAPMVDKYYDIGVTPTMESYEDGMYIVDYEFLYWELSDEDSTYGQRLVYYPVFEENKHANPAYEDVYEKQKLINFIMYNGTAYSMTYNSSDVYQYRYTLFSSYYIGYISEYDMFSLAYGGQDVVAIYFRYQLFNETRNNGIASVGNGFEYIDATVSAHELSYFSGSYKAEQYLKDLVVYANEFCIKRGYGYLTD